MNQTVELQRLMQNEQKTAPSMFLTGARPLLLQMLNQIAIGQLTLTLPCGQVLRYVGQQDGIHAQLDIFDLRAIRAIEQRADIGLAESYRDGWVDSPDMLALLRLVLANQAALADTLRGKWYGKLIYRLKHFKNRNTKAGSAKNIHAHYDLGNDFYRLWLDPSMTYSAAWFRDGNLSLEQAQWAKYARLFDQLGVQAGDRVLEIGCGWGGFAEYAAKRGVHVTGVSLSVEQLKYANARLAALNLSHLVDLRYQDYRDIQAEQPFDAIVSIEMIEAVGEAYWPSYFQQLQRLVKSGGHVAIQAITIDEQYFDHYLKSTDFIQQYIFPGGMLASPTRLRLEVQNVGLAWQNVMSFGLDYAETLRLWREKFDQVLPQVRALGFDEGFIRLWRFYYVYCEAGFLSHRTSVYQVLLQKP